MALNQVNRSIIIPFFSIYGRNSLNNKFQHLPLLFKFDKNIDIFHNDSYNDLTAFQLWL